MTEEEFDFKIAEIHEKASNLKKELFVDYAHSNNSYKIGDIVKDHSSIIKIERITVTFGYLNKYPQCIYRGPRLKKDLKPYKSGEHDSVSQTYIVDS